MADIEKLKERRKELDRKIREAARTKAKAEASRHEKRLIELGRALAMSERGGTSQDLGERIEAAAQSLGLVLPKRRTRVAKAGAVHPGPQTHDTSLLSSTPAMEHRQPSHQPPPPASSPAGESWTSSQT